MTQFAFDRAGIAAWARALRRQGIDAPIRFGLSGVTSLPKLIKFARLCGVGSSLTVLTRNAGSILKAVREHDPGEIVVEIEAAMRDDSLLLVELHFFSFGGWDRTLAWLDSQRKATGSSDTGN